MEYKIAVLGSAAVGKSCIVVRYLRDSFTDDVCIFRFATLLIASPLQFNFFQYDPTIEDSYSKSDEFGGKVRMLSILDTAGMVC